MNTLTHYIQEAEKQTTFFPHSAQKRSQEDALFYLKKNNLPDRKTESWKYTNLNSMLEKNFLVSKNDKSLIDERYESVMGAYNIYFNNGIYVQSISDHCPLVISDIKDLSSDEFSAYQNQITADLKEDFSYLLNHAFLNLGYIITLPETITLSKPIIFHHIISGDCTQTNSFNIIQIKNKQTLNLLEIYKSEKEVFFNPTTIFVCEEESRAEHIVLQNASTDALFLGCIQSILKKSSTYNNVCFNFGSKQSRWFLASNLEEEYASTALHGLYPLVQDQHHDTFAKIHHKAPNTFGDQLYKGIITDKAKGIFTGKILVEKEAQQTQAKQLNKNLLLNTKAHAYSRPQLEVYADDVKCAHGSTTGQLSEEELFYFEARGINKDKARKMLAKAFAYDVVLKIKNSLFREFIQKQLEKKQVDIL